MQLLHLSGQTTILVSSTCKAVKDYLGIGRPDYTQGGLVSYKQVYCFLYDSNVAQKSKLNKIIKGTEIAINRNLKLL